MFKLKVKGKKFIISGILLLILLLLILNFRTTQKISKSTLDQSYDPPKKKILHNEDSLKPQPTNIPITQTKKESLYDSLPEINYFEHNKSDQWLVDMDIVKGGFPFLGKNSTKPHSGAHVHFGDDYKTWPKGGAEASNYPPIYAVADGIINRITPTLKVGANDRYGINLAIAREGNTIWSLEYSIEPFVLEPSKDFYKQFIKVKEGQRVKKGEIIGFMYLNKAGSNGAHIHFELIADGQPIMKVPAIFTSDLVNQFYKHIKTSAYDGSIIIPSACMGWKIKAEENPFTSQAEGCLQ